MSELAPKFPLQNLSDSISVGVNKVVFRLSSHWLAAANTFFFLYAGLPFLAPILLTNGHSTSANGIYWVYHLLCHLFPSRAYFVAGEQVCLCHRCLAIYGSIFLGGVAYSLARTRLKPLPVKWYPFFLLPMALDGGMGMASELLQFIPMAALWIAGLVVIGLAAAVLLSQKLFTWQVAVILGSGILALAYLQFIGPHQSNLFLRNFTGILFGLGTVWVAYPLMDEGFADVHQDAQAKLAEEHPQNLYG